MSNTYILGRSTQEYERLMLQSRLLRPYTEKYFRAAGLVPGMRVLDVGSGVGDVALLAADIVGPAGSVVGIDRDDKAIERGRLRAAEQGCSSWLTFRHSGLDEFEAEAEGSFDAVVGRYILLYQPHPAATLRRLLKWVRPGGVVVFHEVDFTDPRSSDPPCELWDRVFGLLGEAFRRSGAPPDFGRRVGTSFVGAGLPFPTIQADTLVGGERGSYLYRWIAATALSIAPRLEALGVSIPADFVLDDTLAERMEEAVLRSGSQVLSSIQFGAWTRKPL